jgi:hypothetical protein
VVSLQRKAHERKQPSSWIDLQIPKEAALHYHCTQNHKIHNAIKKSQYISDNVSEDLTKKIEGNNVTIIIAFLLEKEQNDYWKNTDKTQKVSQIKTMEDGNREVERKN